MNVEDLKIMRDGPILIAGPTASGKSGLALRLADDLGATIVNADALQVYDCWSILTARPTDDDLKQAPHALYGHVPYDQDYSVGTWLSEVATLLDKGPVIIVGGTGLYFRALTEGLADIPLPPQDIRDRAMTMDAADMLADLDRETIARIDIQNPRRVQRAWEVQKTTGKGIAQWHDETPAPLLPLEKVTAIHLQPDTTWLNTRIETRFGQMIDGGGLEEARAMQDRWNPRLQSCQAIGAPEMMAHLAGEMDLDAAKTAAIIATRQYAKRQRTWFRARMRNWQSFDPGQ